MSDVKALLDMVKAVKELGVAAKQVLKDGKVDLSDLPVALGLIKDLSDITAAVSEAKDIPADVKAIDADGITQVAAAVVDAVNAIQAA